MALITRAAYLEICPRCHNHGHVVCADDTTSAEFVTKKKALEEVGRLSKSKKVDGYELPELERQIDVCHLVEESDDLEHWLQGNLHKLKAHGQARAAILNAAFTSAFAGCDEGPPTIH